MPFAVATRYDAGLTGNLKVAVGTWSGSEGDATGIVTVTGGRVLGALFYTQDTNGPTELVRYQGAAGVANGTVDISVFNRTNVTSGVFLIFYQ